MLNDASQQYTLRRTDFPFDVFAQLVERARSPVIMIVPFTNAEHVTRSFPNNVLVNQPEGRLAVDSVVLTGQVRAVVKTCLLRYRGSLAEGTIEKIDRALRITLDL